MPDILVVGVGGMVWGYLYLFFALVLCSIVSGWYLYHDSSYFLMSSTMVHYVALLVTIWGGVVVHRCL